MTRERGGGGGNGSIIREHGRFVRVEKLCWEYEGGGAKWFGENG